MCTSQGLEPHPSSDGFHVSLPVTTTVTVKEEERAHCWQAFRLMVSSAQPRSASRPASVTPAANSRSTCRRCALNFSRADAAPSA